MDRGTFMDIVGIHYNDIKRLYISRDANKNKRFNEDAFNEAFIKCAKHFGNNIIEKDEAIKYFWVAYTNTSKGDYKYDAIIELQEEYDEDITDEEESFAQKFYKIIMQAIEYSYSEEDMLIYSLYKYHGWKKEELIEAGYNCNNFDVRIKTIHKFVKEYSKKYCGKSYKIKSLE